MPADLPIAVAMAEAWNAHDAEAILSRYADDAVVIRSGFPDPIRGRDALRARVEGMLEALPDIRVEVLHALVEGDDEASLARVTGTHKGDLTLVPGAPVPPTLKRVTYEIAFFVTMDASGRIAHERAIYDPLEVLRQVGAAPALERPQPSRR